MSKPIEDNEFWKERIQDARKNGRLYHSVFHAPQETWKSINDYHRRILADNIKAGDKVLDAGCGYGRLAQLLPPGIEYLGVDKSEAFLATAKELSPHLDVRQADLRELPFEDAEFDWAICVSIKRMVSDNLGSEAWDIMESELLRVSKALLILEYGGCEEFEILTRQ